MAKAVKTGKSGVKKAKATLAGPKARTNATGKASKKPVSPKAPARKKPAAKKLTAKIAPKPKEAPTKARAGAAKPKKASAKVAGTPPAQPKPTVKTPSKSAPKAKPKTAAVLRQPVITPRPVAPAAPPPAPAHTPDVGDRAPDFLLPGDDGASVSLAGFSGRKIVLYFYPKDDTPGCTTEAIAFSKQKAAFEAANTIVLGVSRDTIAAHCRFRDKHGLTVKLISDETGEMLQAYGVWVEKTLYGRTYMGINRTTLLIDGGGTIRKVWRKVKVQGHADEVLAAAMDI